MGITFFIIGSALLATLICVIILIDIFTDLLRKGRRRKMAASTEKTILFGRVAEGKAVHLWPIAVFNTDRDARSYVALLRLAQVTGNADVQLTLDPGHRKDDNGAILPGVKWSLVTVPYAPAPELVDDDVETSGTSPTS